VHETLDSKCLMAIFPVCSCDVFFDGDEAYTSGMDLVISSCAKLRDNHFKKKKRFDKLLMTTMREKTRHLRLYPFKRRKQDVLDE